MTETQVFVGSFLAFDRICMILMLSLNPQTCSLTDSGTLDGDICFDQVCIRDHLRDPYSVSEWMALAPYAAGAVDLVSMGVFRSLR